MKKNSFVISAIILALGGFFAKAIGAIYKIPLTNILGSSGMGLYYLIFPIYSLIITICSSGISVSLSMEVAKCRKVRNIYNEHKLFRVALIITFLISLFFTIIILIFSKTIAEMQGNVNASIGYITISPAIIISSLIATIRGYFQGIENMVPTTVSLIIEQIAKLSIGLILAHRLCVYGIGYAVVGAIIGVTVSEIVALIIIAINYISYKGQLRYNYRNLFYKSKRKFNHLGLIKNKIKTNKKILSSQIYKTNKDAVRYSTKVSIKKLLKSSVVNTLSSIVIPVATMLDSFMIINILVSSGFSSHVSTALYGLSGGVVQSLTSLPIILITGIATTLVPSLSGLVAQNDTNEIKHRTKFFIKITWVLSLIMFVIVYVYAEDYIRFLYGDGLDSVVIDEYFYLVRMMKVNSVSIIYYAFLQTLISIFQAIGKSFIPFITLLVSVVVRTIFVYSLTGIVEVNIFGGLIANIIFLIISSSILIWNLKKYMQFDMHFMRELFQPIIVSGIVFVFMVISDWALKSSINYFASMISTAIVGIVIYILWIYFGNVFSKKEKKYLNFSRKKVMKSLK
ncbi:MAG: polysaccharide biosynthesis protein [Clostridiales bacterium]|nr:polysaccharide biosynthesis protein [Clostridiales bacterium]